MMDDTIHIGGTVGQKYIGTSWVAARNESSNFPGRKWLVIQNKSDVRMAVTHDNTKVFKECIELDKAEKMVMPVSDSVTIYVMAQTATGRGKKVAIWELG